MTGRPIKRLKIGPHHRHTGETRHHKDGVLLPAARSLEVQAGSQGGYYLLYLNDSGSVMTDTWHATLDDALHQATFEYGVTPHEWSDVAS